MKQKKYFILAAAALAFAACSNDEIMPEEPVQQTVVDDGSVKFDVYVNRGTTRAGQNGPLTTTTLQSGDGFGVFGYYTNGESYTGSFRPDFFYNQKVYWKAAATTPATSADQWYYSPIKYWPNEFGSDAISDQVDKVTLFAYAPWVPVTPLTGLVTASAPDNAVNIIGMTRNNATGDPFVKYVSSLISDNSVDLCYGVAATDFTSSNSAYNPNGVTAGQPYIDVVKPGTDDNSKIKFDFRHALAQLNVTIDANVKDMTNEGLSTPLANGIDTDHTRIWVRSVTFEGVTLSGSLNLNSTFDSPNWYDLNGTSRISTGSITVYDGRKDGREANELASSEAPAKLNPNIIQAEPYTLTSGAITKPSELGVTKEPINLFTNKTGSAIDASAPVFVIPTKEIMKVVIVYDVETVDENLPTYLSDGSTKGSTIENRIYKEIKSFDKIEAGRKYTLNLHLGMRSVDFDATVTDWEDYQAPVDLPSNALTFAAASSPAGTGSITLAADAASCTFDVSGLASGAIPTTLTAAGGNVAGASVTATPATGAGVSTVTVSPIGANTTTSNIKDGQTVTVGDGTNSVEVTVKQLAAPINFTDLTADTNVKLTCTWTVGTPATTAAFKTLMDSDKGKIQVFKDGIDITAQCTFNADNTITIAAPYALANGNIVKVVLQANDAPAESKTITVSGL